MVLLIVAHMLQAHGVQLDMAQLVLIGTSAVLAALSAAAIPSAGLVTMVMVMQASPFAAVRALFIAVVCTICKLTASVYHYAVH